MTNAESIKRDEETILNIREMYPDIKFPEPILEPLYFGRLSKTVVQGRKLVLDKETGAQFDIVSDAYKLFRHEVALNELLNAIPEEFGKPEIKGMMIRGGARAAFYAEFPEMPTHKIGKGEGSVRILLRNSYDRSSFVNFNLAIKELVCSNGLVVFKNKASGKAKHLEGAMDKFVLAEKINEGMEMLSETHKIWDLWAETRVDIPFILETVSELPFSPKEQERLMMLPLLNHGGISLQDLGSDATLWSINSAGTQMVHEINSEERKMELEYKIPYIINKASNRLN